MKKISNLDIALDAIKERRKKWRKEHPDEIESVCSICEGTGLKLILKDEFGNIHPKSDKYKPGIYEFYEPCPCTKGEVTAIMRNNLKYSSVPGLYADALIENLSKDVYTNVRSYEMFQIAKNDAIRFISAYPAYEEKGMGLYIWSKVKGSGKSRLASTISNELTRKGVRNKYASVSNILTELSSSWKKDDSSEDKIIRKYVEPRLLILDDLGAKSGYRWIDDRLFEIVDGRYSAGKPTIITSNYEADKLPFDERIADRICEQKRYEMIHMPEESVRRNSNTDSKAEFRDIYDKFMKEKDKGKEDT